MRRDLRHLSALCLLLAACKGDGGDDTGDTDADTTSDEPFADAPVDPDVQNAIPAGYTASAPARLIFMGDSITDGVGASRDNLAYTELLQVNAAAKWPEFDEVDLEAVWPALPEVFNFAISGATTDSMFDEQLNLLDDAFEFPVAGETIVVFTIGGNDMQRALAPGANAEQVANGTLARFEQIVGWLQNPSRFPDGLYVYATNVHEPSDGEGSTPSCFFGIDYADKLPALEAYNEDLRAFAAEAGIAVLDLRGHFLGHGFYSEAAGSAAYDADDPTRWFDRDCIHPNDRGHHELRRLLHAAITGSPFRTVIPGG